MDIILRTCDRVQSVHYDVDGKTERLVGPDHNKLDIILACLKSLIVSMNRVNNNIKFVIVDDHSSEKCVEKIKEITSSCIHSVELLSMEDTGNGASLKTCYELAYKSKSDLFYFVEDDYLHYPTCIEEMLYDRNEIMKKLNHDVAIFPSDNVDNYKDTYKNSIPCYMVLGKNRHWRTVNNATYTFMCSKNILERYWYLFKLAGKYDYDGVINEDNTTNIIWNAPYKNAGGAYLLSPIPSLALHLHFKDHIIPFINWNELWEEYKN